MSPALLDHIVARWAGCGGVLAFRDLPVDEQAEMTAAYLTEQRIRAVEMFDQQMRAKRPFPKYGGHK